MKNKVRTKWILTVIPTFFFLMNGCASTRLQSSVAAPSAHFLFMEPNHMQIADFLHLGAGQSLYRSTAAWILPDLVDVRTRTFRDVQKEFEQLDWEVNQLINSLSDMIHEIDSHQKGRLQINRTKLETIHDTIRDKGEVWISSKGGNTLSGKGFERMGCACNDLLELFENFGNPDRYRPREGEGTSSTEHSSSTIPPSPNAYSEDLQPTPSISADTKNTAHVDFQAVVSIYGSDTYFTPSLSSDFNMQGSMTTFGLSKDLTPTQTPRSPELDNTFSHVDVSSGSQISVGATPLLVSKSFSNTTRPSVEVASSAVVTVLVTTATPVLNSASAVSTHTLRASSTEGGVTVSSGNLIGHQSSWSVLESSIEQSDINGGSSVKFLSILMPSSSFSDVAKLSTISIASYQPHVSDPAKSSLITSSSFDDITRTSSLLPLYAVPTGSKMDTLVDSAHSASIGDINSVLSSWDDVSSSQAAESFWMLTSLFSGVTQPMASLSSSHEASTQTALHISADSSSSASTPGTEGMTWNSRQGDSSQMATQMQSKSDSDNSNSRTPFYTSLPGETQIRNSLASSWVGSSSRPATSSATQETLEQTSFNASLLFTAGAETNFAPEISSITPSGVNAASFSSLPASGTAGAKVDSQGISQVSFTGMDVATSTARSDISSSAVQITRSTRLTDVLATSPPSFTSATTLRSSADVTTSEPLMSSFRSNVNSLVSSPYKSVFPALSESIAPLAASTLSLTDGTLSTNGPPSCSDGRTTCGLPSVGTLATRGMGTLSTSSLLTSSSPPSSSSVTQQRATATAAGTSQDATSSASINESTTRNFETTPRSSSIPSPTQSSQGANKGARAVGSQFLFVLVLAVRLL